MIPEISDDRLTELAARIKPLARFVEVGNKLMDAELAEDENELGELYLIEPCDLRVVGFNTDPRPAGKAPQLRQVGVIKTFHTSSSLFNPSIAEVLAQIPEEYIDSVTHFETVRDFPQPQKHVGMETYFMAFTYLYQAV